MWTQRSSTSQDFPTLGDPPRIHSPCGNKVSTQNFAGGSLLSMSVSPSITVSFSLRDKFPQDFFSRHTGQIWRCYAADLRIGISPFSLHMGVVFINTRQKKKTCTEKVQIKICYMRLLHRDFPTAAPTGKTNALQEEVYKASAIRSDCPRYVPMLISARFTWILPTRLPVPIGA